MLLTYKWLSSVRYEVQMTWRVAGCQTFGWGCCLKVLEESLFYCDFHRTLILRHSSTPWCTNDSFNCHSSPIETKSGKLMKDWWCFFIPVFFFLFFLFDSVTIALLPLHLTFDQTQVMQFKNTYWKNQHFRVCFTYSWSVYATVLGTQLLMLIKATNSPRKHLD